MDDFGEQVASEHSCARDRSWHDLLALVCSEFKSARRHSAASLGSSNWGTCLNLSDGASWRGVACLSSMLTFISSSEQSHRFSTLRSRSRVGGYCRPRTASGRHTALIERRGTCYPELGRVGSERESVADRRRTWSPIFGSGSVHEKTTT